MIFQVNNCYQEQDFIQGQLIIDNFQMFTLN